MLYRIIRQIKSLICPSSKKSEIDKMKEKGLMIGASTIVHSPQCFDSIYPWLIEVGENCLISTEVKLIAHDSSTNRLNGITKVGRINIGNHVYLGHRVTVLCNVTIGDNVVVGAGSLVNCDLKENSVYAGVPAHFICSIEEFDEKHKRQFLNAPVFEADWRYWRDDATPQERMAMKEQLENTVGYILDQKGNNR